MKTKPDFFDSFPPDWDKDRLFWQLALSQFEDGKLLPITQFDIQPIDPMDAMLKAMQQSIIIANNKAETSSQMTHLALNYQKQLHKRLEDSEARIERLEEFRQ